MKFNKIFASVLIASIPYGAMASDSIEQKASQKPMTWTTLGTAGGPVVHPDRSQPANLLTAGNNLWLVDCGDGALEKLSATGHQPSDIDAVFISHLHLDHIGGLQGLIGLRWMQHQKRPLTIYGPPGTQEVVSNIIASLGPSVAIDIGVNKKRMQIDPAKVVEVVTMTGGSQHSINGITVTAAQNSHFDNQDGEPADTGTESLSYRFSTKNYSIGYTGDTGESEAVIHLFKGVDLIVSEVIDLQGIIANLNSPKSPMPEEVKPRLIKHLMMHHLTPQEAGKIAAEAGAKRLVLTHLAIAGPLTKVSSGLISAVHETYQGEVEIAHDVETF